MNGVPLRALVDTGASCSLIFEGSLPPNILPSQGRTCRLTTVSGEVTTAKWVKATLTWTGPPVVDELIVVPTTASEHTFDLILGRHTMKQLFGDVIFTSNDEIISVKGKVRRMLPSTCKTCTRPAHTVELDADGEHNLGPMETIEELKQLASDSLRQATIGQGFRPWVDGLVDSLPGLVRRYVVPARTSCPFRATIQLKPGSTLPYHTPTLMSSRMVTTLSKTLSDLQAGGLIERSTSEAATRVHLIPKPSNPKELRFVCDYRDLNEVVQRDAYALPRIEMCLQIFEGSHILSKIDLKSFFFQIPLTEASRPLTAITTPVGLFQWNVVPQGLKTSPAMAQRFISWILRDGGKYKKTK